MNVRRIDPSASYGPASLALIGGFFLFRLLVMGQTGLGDSESYYWAWSQRFDLSYYDHPPLVAWLIRLFTDLGGDTSFWVRFPSALLFVVMGLLFYRLSVELFDDRRVAFYAILTFNIVPMFGIGALQMVPDIPSAVCYLLYVLLLWRVLNGGPTWLWPVMGAVIGIGMLGKYFAVLLIPSTLILVAAIPEYRFWFRRIEPYLMAPVGLLFFSPVFFWNFANDWPSFRFHLTDRHHGAAFEYRNFEQLIGGQLLYMSPVILVLLLMAVWSGFRKAREGDRRYALLVSFSAPTLLFFYVVCAWTNESEPHWPAFGYLTAMIMLPALGLDAWRTMAPGAFMRRVRAYQIGVGFAGLMFVAFYIHVFYPILPIKPKYDLVNELYGWDAVGVALLEEQGRLEADGVPHEKIFGLAHHWVLCAQMLFATGDRLPVSCMNQKVDQFDFWDDEKSLIGKTALVVTDLRFEETPDQLYRFATSRKLREIPLVRGGEEVRRFTIWRGDDYRGRRE
ncbi:MAG: glycosyltransferase family 39 protein [Nitrospinae bacterium]|nr:glycosyltransferase family 39 protein [Nitrospinota bacterium]